MILHVDATEGASGDLLLAALLDAGASLDAIRAGLAGLPLPGLGLEAPEVRVRGFRARRLEVALPPDRTARGPREIAALLDAAGLPPRVRARAGRTFDRLAEAEAKVHGVPLERVHFHEVGALDSLLDVVGVALALELLAVDEITFSALGVGSGTIESAHGPIPVPVPAVVELTRGVPVRRTGAPTEILTPTGAALLVALGRPAAPGETLVGEAHGVSCGRREWPGGPSLLRVTVGRRAAGASDGPAPPPATTDEVEVLEANLDDLSPEILPRVLERALAAGAVEAYLVPVLMKKGRPGHVLTVLAPPDRAAEIAALIFRETTTLGIRRRRQARWILPRSVRTLATPWGPIDVKVAETPDGIRTMPEHESLRALAERTGRPLLEVQAEVGTWIRTSESIGPEAPPRDAQ